MINTTPSQPAGFDGGAYLGAPRTCNKCGVPKFESDFGKFHRGPGGLNHKCKECCNKQGKGWREANPEIESARGRKYRTENPEKRKETCANWRERNLEVSRAAGREYHKKNAAVISEKSKKNYLLKKDKIAATNKAWAEKNPEAVRAKGRRWAANNPEKVRNKCSRRRAAMRLVPWADQSAILTIYMQASRMSRRSPTKHEVDHIYPLKSKWVCGLHVEANLQILPAHLNRAKKNKLPGDRADELWDADAPHVYYEYLDA